MLGPGSTQCWGAESPSKGILCVEAPWGGVWGPHGGGSAKSQAGCFSPAQPVLLSHPWHGCWRGPGEATCSGVPLLRCPRGRGSAPAHRPSCSHPLLWSRSLIYSEGKRIHISPTNRNPNTNKFLSKCSRWRKLKAVSQADIRGAAFPLTTRTALCFIH